MKYVEKLFLDINDIQLELRNFSAYFGSHHERIIYMQGRIDVGQRLIQS